MLSISVCTFITDFKYGKILNKHLKMVALIGLIMQIVYMLYQIDLKKHSIFFNDYFINLIIGALISICLYYFDIWGAGDSKYFILLLLLAPMCIFKEPNKIAFQVELFLIVTFSVAFIYIFLESLYLFINETPVVIIRSKFTFLYIQKFIIKWMFSYSIIIIVYKIVGLISKDYFGNNIILIRLIIILIMIYLLDNIKCMKFYFPIIILGSLIFVSNCFINSRENKIIIDYKMILIILIVIILRVLCSRYNYKRIKTLDIKEGMIISVWSISGFLYSKVKGLPKFGTESVRSKITFDEAESIKRWASSKYGQEYIYIVRQIPFAPFISFGAIISYLYFILQKGVY
jgi:hypothetical protein